MYQPDLFAFPANPFKQGTQNHALWEHLKAFRCVTTRELHYNLKCDTARIRDCRKVGLIIECHTIPGVTGDRLYKVVL